MKKLFLISFLTLGSVLGFVSCGSDDETPPPTPPDLTLKNTALVKGSYTGSYTVSLPDLLNKTYTASVNPTISFVTDNSKASIITDVSELGIVEPLNDFVYTSIAKTEIAFSMPSISTGAIGLIADNRPAHILAWFPEYVLIEKIDLTLSKTTAKLILSDNSLKYVYDGTITLKAKNSAGNYVSPSPVHRIKYDFSLTKK